MDHDDLCHGWSWQIADEEQLVEDVALVALGQYRHVSKILAGLNSRPMPTTAEHVADAVAKLTVSTDGTPWHRDGWLFQTISWIAAHHNKGGAVIRAPHIRKADHGFDGIQLELSDDGSSITALVVFEDKATTGPRATILNDVWPDLVNLEAGKRITELTHEATALLETQLGIFPAVDIDRAVSEIVWKEARRYRVSITVDSEHEAENARAALFGGFNNKVPGDVVRRRAETVVIPNMRNWMAQFSERVKNRVAELIENV
jgi:hypothetical protein